MDTLIKVKRKWLTDKSTIGELFFDNSTERICYTLEDCLRDKKIDGKTCIPAGFFEVVFSFSNRFQKLLPLISNVPGFEGVRIHPGNTDVDTEGCLLVGFEKGDDMIMNSRSAFTFLFTQLKGGMENGKVYIEITNEPIEDKRTALV